MREKRAVYRENNEGSDEVVASRYCTPWKGGGRWVIGQLGTGSVTSVNVADLSTLLMQCKASWHECWLLPALKKWNLDRSYQPWSQRTQKTEVALEICSHLPVGEMPRNVHTYRAKRLSPTW